MTWIPQLLAPTGTESIPLPSGFTTHIPKSTPMFVAWQRAVPFDRYGNKAVIDHRGKPLFAEFVILRLFEEAGWNGVWVDTYRKCFRRDASARVDLPTDKLRLLERIYASAGAKSGCFDVFVWKEEAIMFAESKRAGRDHIRDSQARWIDAALKSGLSTNALLVVEWTLAEEPTRR